MKIVLASSNPGKLAEFDALLQGSDIELVAQSTLGINDVEETGLSLSRMRCSRRAMLHAAAGCRR
ncbi:dITP/XTP pyrophosphatase [mine drainage metagenome]|uniref:DITP/XTP pyrophosphatase n=1 Tax=mine drainage metagenome TaxID=410659 RepID=T1C019_9ZZZZ